MMRDRVTEYLYAVRGPGAYYLTLHSRIYNIYFRIGSCRTDTNDSNANTGRTFFVFKHASNLSYLEIFYNIIVIKKIIYLKNA